MPWAALGAAAIAGAGSALSPGGAFGSKPSLSTGSQTLLDPSQQAMQSFISQYLQGGITGAPSNVSQIQPYSGQFTAPLSGYQNNLLTALFGGGGAAGGGGGGAVSSALAAQDPTMAALTGVLSGQPQDYSQYFKTNVAAPMEDVFQNQTLPSIKGAFARSAGGTYSGSDTTGGGTGFQGAVTGATKDMDKQLQQAMSSLSTQAITNASRNQVAGIGLAPSVGNMGINALNAAMPAAALPQQNQQQNLSAQYNDYLRQIQQLQSLINPAAGTMNLGSVSPYQVVNPGQPGFITQLLTSILGGAGGALGGMAGGAGGAGGGGGGGAGAEVLD